jgi:hypothetical protein
VWESFELIDYVGKQFELHVVKADDCPPHSVNGPCETGEEILRLMLKYFPIDEAGFMRKPTE